ncbi:MAG: septum formation initiator family protein [Lachnospiraceae bacterium]|nr:septum formation initiator family protein [Lachnospiraceae bacterium]
MAVILMMAVFIGIIAFQIKDLEKVNQEKTIELNKKQEQYEKESERTEELEEQRVYVQTKKYVEEAAKKLGFVYPDELILKPKQD